MKQHRSTVRITLTGAGGFAERFWSKVGMKHKGCWVWQGQIGQANGYGVTYRDGRHQYAHRVAYELKYGAIPPGLRVCHACDNPPCCRPDHLFLGTQEENILDMRRKGRNPHPLKLTEQSVLDIRRRYADREVIKVTMQQLADEYGVYKGYISKIIHRQKWRHI
ncbi:MAG: HNH endonuclease [Acidobacteria bacterium]|nr:HNH endonuclease [Acidobacteriota bacterium]